MLSDSWGNIAEPLKNPLSFRPHSRRAFSPSRWGKSNLSPTSRLRAVDEPWENRSCAGSPLLPRASPQSFPTPPCGRSDEPTDFPRIPQP